MPVEGQILGGKYRLERLVGSGGFASVWAARNVMLDRLVALKILSENYARMPGFLPRFLREAKLASRAIHKNIVAVEDIDQSPDGLVYLVMELLEGYTLADELKGGRSLSLERTLQIICPTLEGLAAAHQLNIIHRDIKPANIFLTKEGSPGPRVRILDLGLAKDLLNDDELTSTDQMVGTPSYLAPEMFMGPQTRRWAPTADVFACGMLTFRMLAGGLPFDRSVANLTPIEQFLARAEFYQSIGQMPGPKQYVPSLPSSIDAVVRNAICLDVRDRYADAGEMLAALREADVSASYLIEITDEDDSTIDLDEDVTSVRLDPDMEEGSDVFGDVETRVDATPYGAAGAGTGAGTEDGESSFGESLTTDRIDAMPQHLRPVAGRTIPPDQGHPSRVGHDLPKTIPPSVERPSGGAQHMPGTPLPGAAAPSYPVVSPSSHPGPATSSEAQKNRSLPPGGAMDERPHDRVTSSSSVGIETPPTKAVEPFGLSSLADSSHPLPHPRAERAAPSTVPRRRRSSLAIFGIIFGVIVVLFGLTAAGLYLTWTMGLWGRYAPQSGTREQGSSTSAGATTQPGPTPEQGRGANDQDGAIDDLISLDVHSIPPGAAVIIDGQRVGTTPYQTSIHRSDVERQLTLRAEGFESIDHVFRSSESQRLEFELQPIEP